MISTIIDQNRKWFKSNHKNCIIYIKLNWNKSFKYQSKISFIIVSVKYDDTKNINNKNLLYHSNRIWFLKLFKQKDRCKHNPNIV